MFKTTVTFETLRVNVIFCNLLIFRNSRNSRNSLFNLVVILWKNSKNLGFFRGIFEFFQNWRPSLRANFCKVGLVSLGFVRGKSGVLGLLKWKLIHKPLLWLSRCAFYFIWQMCFINITTNWFAYYFNQHILLKYISLNIKIFFNISSF